MLRACHSLLQTYRPPSATTTTTCATDYLFNFSLVLSRKINRKTIMRLSVKTNPVGVQGESE